MRRTLQSDPGIVPTRNMHKMAAVRIEPIGAVAIAFVRDAGRWEPPAPLGDHVVVVLDDDPVGRKTLSPPR
jgi:hypothetical protein